MKTVKVKDIGVQVKGISYFKNAVFEVTDEDYEPIKEYVEVLKEDRKQIQKNVNERVVVIKVENKELDLKEVEEYLYNCLANFGKEPIEENPNPEGEPNNVDSHKEKDNPEGNDGEDTGKNNESEDEELEALKERAKKLGIKNAHNMKKETLIAKIQETEETGSGENPNPEGE